jgi:hypothetical protein
MGGSERPRAPPFGTQVLILLKKGALLLERPVARMIASPPPAPTSGAMTSKTPIQRLASHRPAVPEVRPVTVQPSTIDGQGAFAAEAVPARLKIGEIRGESISVQQARIRATRAERIMIVELSDKKAIDFSQIRRPHALHQPQLQAQRAAVHPPGPR